MTVAGINIELVHSPNGWILGIQYGDADDAEGNSYKFFEIGIVVLRLQFQWGFS